jgi:hypothetical protein
MLKSKLLLMENTKKMGVKGLFLGCLLMVSFFSNAQNESDLGAFLKANKADVGNLIGGYVGPVIRGASYGMTGGWYTTGKVHKKLGFDLGVSLTAAYLPTSDNYFTPHLVTPGATFVNNTNPSLGAPTFVGPKDKTTYTETYSTPLGSQTFTINGPEGLALKKNIGFAAVPVPMIQAGIGLPFHTDLKVRFLPQVNASQSKVQMLGFGLMHDLTHYLPGGSLLPFDLSVLAAYNMVKGSTSLVNSDSTSTPNKDKPITTSDGKINYKLNSWVAQVIISKKISVLTGYLGVGYGAVSSNVDVTGTFNYRSDSNQSFSISDPFATKYKTNTTKITAGLRLKLGPIYMVGDYTLQKYNALTVGLGVAVR